MMEEPLDLSAFLKRVEAGELGPFPPEQVRAFLREVERDIIGNIHAMTEAHPHLAAEVEERIEETHRMISDLSRRYGSG
jgi:hypothetical protein